MRRSFILIFFGRGPLSVKKRREKVYKRSVFLSTAFRQLTPHRLHRKEFILQIQCNR